MCSSLNHGLWLLFAVLQSTCVAAASEYDGTKQSEGGAKNGQPGIALEKLRRGPHKNSGKDLFAARAWGSEPHAISGVSQKSATDPVAVGSAVPPAAPVTPTAPPLPFTYMGKMVDEQSGKLVLYLAKGDVAYTVSSGDLIDDTYRVEAITDTELKLIYIPLNIKQILIIGGNNS